MKYIFVFLTFLLINLPHTLLSSEYDIGYNAYQNGNFLDALSKLKPLAKKGNSDAQLILGIMYDNGQGVKENFKKARYWFKYSSQKGNEVAQFNLGANYVMNNLTTKELILGYMWTSISMSGGNVQEGASDLLKFIEIKLSQESKNDAKIYVKDCLKRKFIACDKKNGEFKEIFPNNDQYIGEFKDGFRHGKGTYLFFGDGANKGDKFMGEYLFGFANGQGTYYWNEGSKYIGDWKDGERHGQGILYYPNKTIKYEGQFVKSNLSGYGTYIWENGNKYIGEWRNNKRHGQGKFIYLNGKSDEGVWKDDNFINEKKPNIMSKSKIKDYKSFCKDIGFTPGTEKFGECVLKAMDKN